MTPNFFRSSCPMMMSFVKAGEMTKTELVDRSAMLRVTRAVPLINTGSLLTLTNFLFNNADGWIPCRLARSEEINVAALPVSGKVSNLNDPFLWEILRFSLFTHGSSGSSSEASVCVTDLIGFCTTWC